MPAAHVRTSTSASGMLTEKTAVPRWSIADGIPIPTAATLSSRTDSTAAARPEQRIGGLDRRRPPLDADDRPVPLDHADNDLRPTDVHADRPLHSWPPTITPPHGP